MVMVPECLVSMFLLSAFFMLPCRIAKQHVLSTAIQFYIFTYVTEHKF